jgi:hypothetical protein
MAGVTIGIAFEIVLMFGLGFPEVAGGGLRCLPIKLKFSTFSLSAWFESLPSASPFSKPRRGSYCQDARLTPSPAASAVWSVCFACSV